MSVRVLSWVLYDSPSTGNDRLVLIAIADEADDDGREAFPSMELIARKARISKRTAIRAVGRLEAGGELLAKRPPPEKRGRGRHNRYVVVMGRDPIALAGAVGWAPPALDAAVAEEWRLSDTFPQAGDKAGDARPTTSRNGAEWCQDSPQKARPGVTRPVDPLTPRSTHPLPGDKARAVEANLASTQAAARAIADENMARLAADRDNPDRVPPAELAAAARAARAALRGDAVDARETGAA